MQKQKMLEKKKNVFFGETKMILKAKMLCFWVRKLSYAFMLILYFLWGLCVSGLGVSLVFIIFLLFINIICSMQKPVFFEMSERQKVRWLK